MKVSREIQELVPYIPGKPIEETKREFNVNTVYKLASNENALGFSPKVKAALVAALDEIHRYPDPSCFKLLEAAQGHWGVERKYLAAGNGSNEIIDLLIRIYCEPGDAILVFEGAFIAYDICARAARVKPITVPLDQGLRMNLQRMGEVLREQKKSQKIRLVFIANPNNPTGVYIPKAEIQKFLAEFGSDDETLIIIDEAYAEFVRAEEKPSQVHHFLNYKNVAVIRTLSKAYGLAGLRVGILFAQTEVIDFFNRVRNPFNVNDLAQVAAIAALQDQSFVEQSAKAVWAGLDYLQQELKNLNLPVTPSQANFLFFDTLRDARAVNQALLRRGVILRPVVNYGFPTQMRMTVGTEVENKAAIKALKEVLKEIPS